MNSSCQWGAASRFTSALVLPDLCAVLIVQSFAIRVLKPINKLLAHPNSLGGSESASSARKVSSVNSTLDCKWTQLHDSKAHLSLKSLSYHLHLQVNHEGAYTCKCWVCSYSSILISHMLRNLPPPACASSIPQILIPDTLSLLLLKLKTCVVLQYWRFKHKTGTEA